MEEKKHLQRCELNGSLYGKKRTTDKKGSTPYNGVNKDDLMKIYNKFYKNQVAALYRAIHHDR